MIHCIYPDCEWEPADVGPAGQSVEQAKRAIIDHINHDHDDAHVIIGCHHELREVERYMARTRNAEGVEVEVGEQVRSECVRCGQFVVEDAPTVVIEGNTFAPPAVAVVQDALGNDVLSIPAKPDDIEGAPA